MNVDIPHEFIKDYCRRWKIREFALFGSVLRDDFRPQSDVDVLVSFDPDANWSLLDQVRMEEELGQKLGRNVDIINKQAIERSKNWIRRREILKTAKVYYAS